MKKLLLSLILFTSLPIFANDGLNYDIKYRVQKIGNELVKYDSEKSNKIIKIGLQTVAYNSTGK